jgi:hypothetical protein
MLSFVPGGKEGGRGLLAPGAPIITAFEGTCGGIGFNGRRSKFTSYDQKFRNIEDEEKRNGVLRTGKLRGGTAGQSLLSFKRACIGKVGVG